MRDVHVPADDDGFQFVKRAEIFSESILPAHAVIKALEPVLRVRRVDADKVKVLIFERYRAPLGAVLLNADVIGDGEGSVLCEYCGAGVALLFGVAPVALIAGKVDIYLAFLKLRLLNAEEVCVQAQKDIVKALFPDCAQSVNVP